MTYKEASRRFRWSLYVALKAYICVWAFLGVLQWESNNRSPDGLLRYVAWTSLVILACIFIFLSTVTNTYFNRRELIKRAWEKKFEDINFIISRVGAGSLTPQEASAMRVLFGEVGRRFCSKSFVDGLPFRFSSERHEFLSAVCDLLMDGKLEGGSSGIAGLRLSESFVRLAQSRFPLNDFDLEVEEERARRARVANPSY